MNTNLSFSIRYNSTYVFGFIIKKKFVDALSKTNLKSSKADFIWCFNKLLKIYITEVNTIISLIWTTLKLSFKNQYGLKLGECA